MAQAAQQLKMAIASMDRARLELDRVIEQGMMDHDAASERQRFAAMAEWAVAYKQYRDCHIAAYRVGLRNAA